MDIEGWCSSKVHKINSRNSLIKGMGHSCLYVPRWLLLSQFPTSLQWRDQQDFCESWSTKDNVDLCSSCMIAARAKKVSMENTEARFKVKVAMFQSCGDTPPSSAILVICCCLVVESSDLNWDHQPACLCLLDLSHRSTKLKGQNKNGNPLKIYWVRNKLGFAFAKDWCTQVIANTPLAKQNGLWISYIIMSPTLRAMELSSALG